MERRAILMAIFVFSLLTIFVFGYLEKPKAIAPVTEPSLTIWWNKGESVKEDESFKNIAAEWQETTGIEVNLEFYSMDGILKAIKNALQQNNLPDILFSPRTDCTQAFQWAKEGKLADVSDVMASVSNLYQPKIIATGKFYNAIQDKESYYAIPFAQSSLHIHYWRDLLSKIDLNEQNIPQDWDGFWNFWQQAQLKLRDAGDSDIYAFGLPMSVEASDTFLIFEQILKEYNIQLVNERGELLVNRPLVRKKIIDVLNWYANFYKNKYNSPDATNWQSNGNNLAFFNRSVLMTINPTLSIPSTQQDDRDIYFQKMGTISFPNRPNGEPSSYITPIKKIVIFNRAKNIQNAKRFLFYFLQPEHLNKYLKGTGGRWLPLADKIWQDSFWQDKKDPHLSVAYAQFQNRHNQFPYHEINHIYSNVDSENVWGQAIERVVKDNWSPEQATDTAIQRIEEIFRNSQ